MKKATGYRIIYDKAGRVNFEGIRGRSGVYIIRENSRIVYIGYSARNLYKTMLRHFQVWNHPGQPVVSYAGSRHQYKARVILLPAKQAVEFEKKLILKYKPRDNRNKYLEYSSQARQLKLKTSRSAQIRKDAPF